MIGKRAATRSGTSTRDWFSTAAFVAPMQPPEPQFAAGPPPQAPMSDEANVRAARVLALAQDTADRVTSAISTLKQQLGSKADLRPLAADGSTAAGCEAIVKADLVMP